MDRYDRREHLRKMHFEAQRAYALAEIKYAVQAHVVGSLSVQNAAEPAVDMLEGLTADERARVVSREEALLSEARVDMVEKRLHAAALRAYSDAMFH